MQRWRPVSLAVATGLRQGSGNVGNLKRLGLGNTSSFQKESGDMESADQYLFINNLFILRTH